MQNFVRAMQISRVFARGAFARLKFLFLLKLSYYFIEKYCRFGRRRLGVRRRRVKFTYYSRTCCRHALF